MLRTIRKLLGEKSKQIKFPIALMGADAVLSIVLYIVCLLYTSCRGGGLCETATN